MSNELLILLITTVSIGFFHTLFGPDHYLPFIVLSKARNWSLRKTTAVTVICGAGHVLSSVFLGMAGIALGIAVTRLESVESLRGNLAAWALIAFGLVYFVWGIRRAFRNKEHKHLHVHHNGADHIHTHNHTREHVHIHEKKNQTVTPWILFTIFLFGPCEPLIPLLMYPAAKESRLGLVAVTFVFGAVTIMTMVGVVLILTMDIIHLPRTKLEKYSHALAGAAICVCGLTIQFLGL